MKMIDRFENGEIGVENTEEVLEFLIKQKLIVFSGIGKHAYLFFHQRDKDIYSEANNANVHLWQKNT